MGALDYESPSSKQRLLYKQPSNKLMFQNFDQSKQMLNQVQFQQADEEEEANPLVTSEEPEEKEKEQGQSSEISNLSEILKQRPARKIMGPKGASRKNS